MSSANTKVSGGPPVPPLDYAPPPGSSGTGGKLINVVQAGARVAALAIIFVSFGLVVGPSFFKAGNIENILRQSAVFAMAGLGMTMVIITAGIDLAAGSIVALSMVVTAMILAAGGSRTGYLASYPILWTMVAVIGGTLVATIVGVTQGMLVTGLNLVPFIVTLGGMQAIRGLTKGIAGNQEISPPANWLSRHLMFPVQGRVFNWQLVPVGVWATLIAALLAGALLRYTKLGRHIYAVGSNEATARLCGVSVSRTKIIVYAMAGLFAGLAGVLEYSKLNLGQPTGAVSYELYVIAACVIGGTSLMGGVGTITGTVIGALMIGTLNIGAQQAEWPKWLQEVAIGVIIVAAAALDQLRARVRT
jgi:ribose transport system permease protein/erythritol transport system permease protein